MTRLFSLLRRPFVILLVLFIRIFAYIMYDKKYLKGRWFQHSHYSAGWGWVLKCWFIQKIVGINRDAPYPVSGGMRLVSPENIIFDPDDLQNFQGVGNYFQAVGAKLYIGKGTYIAPNVGFITSNHDLYDPNLHMAGEDIVLDEKCWIGMNSVILPGVVLGAHTVVGAGSVVTKSFPNGYCVIAGNPAKVVKILN
jgi:acetyltransferase-like isoleucine patch superfamily enzyme